MKLDDNLQVNAGYDRADVEKVAKKAVKLTPERKNSKRTIYKELDDQEDYELEGYKKRESILDYYDDVEHDEQEYDEQEYDDEEEYEEEE